MQVDQTGLHHLFGSNRTETASCTKPLGMYNASPGPSVTSTAGACPQRAHAATTAITAANTTVSAGVDGG